MKLSTFAPCLLLLASLAQAGTVQVTFDHPERFTDAGRLHDADTVREVIDQHLQALGRALLPAGQTLQVTITDIDLAGEINPWIGRMQGVRVMGRTVDWPVIELRYTLSEGQQVLAQGSERVADLAYLMRPLRSAAIERLPYEQRMLSTWFAGRFGPRLAR